MSTADSAYVELHAHSAYSFLDGASQPAELVEQAARLGYGQMAISDHDSVAGAMEFARAAEAVGVAPITGAEVTVHDPAGGLRHVTLLARTRPGYANLCRLLTESYRGEPVPESMRSGLSDPGAGHVRMPGAPHRGPTLVRGSRYRPEPSVMLEQLCEHAEGLTLLTGCARNGLIPAQVALGRERAARETIAQLQDAFGPGNVHVELQKLLMRGDAQRTRALRQLASECRAQVVATGNVHAHSARRARLHEVLTAIDLGTTVDACAAQRRCNLGATLATAEQMRRRFREVPEAVSNSVHIAESIEFRLTSDLGYEYPVFGGEGGESPDQVLAATCLAELDARYRNPARRQQAAARLERELAVIRNKGLSGFFLLHRDILQLAREVAIEVRGAGSARMANPPGRGRGSSVESIVCYLTGLSHIDPLQAGLRMGRFLNDDLETVPDIDLDFPRDIRHELLARVIDRYGTDHTAMVAAHATYRKRSAVRDVGAALGLSKAALQRIVKRCDSWSAKAIAEHVDEEGTRWDAFRMLTREIADLPRHTGQHSGGVIVSTRPLNEMVPLMPAAMPGRTICQWDKDSCADAGFLKIDVLGLGMLSAVEECIEHVHETTGQVVDLSRIDFDDRAVYQDIGDGDTVGAFQIESRAQMQSTRRTRPENLHDLAIQVALIRPGPIVGKSVNPYVSARESLRKTGTADIHYDHPILEPVLKDTYGAIVFQDQVIEVAMAAAGFSAGQADGLRRVMTRKHAAKRMEEYRAEFIAGAATNGIDAETADTIFGRLTGFAKYGFPRAHSVSFALLAYQSVWLRRYVPAHFFAALLNAQPMGFYPPDSLLRDAGRHGVSALPVSVNDSDARCIVEAAHRDATPIGSIPRQGDRIRMGLAYVNGISWEDACGIVVARERGGPFGDVADLARRAYHLDGRQLELLVMAGAADSLEGTRREQLWQLGLVARERLAGVSESGDPAHQLPMDADTPGAPAFAQMSLWETVTADYAHTGVSLNGHPVALLRELAPDGLADIRTINAASDGTPVDFLGAIIARQRPPTARGVTFLLAEDEHGTANVVVPPNLYERRRLVVRGEPIMRIRGRVEVHDTVVNVIATDIEPLPNELRRTVPPTHPGKRFG